MLLSELCHSFSSKASSIQIGLVTENSNILLQTLLFSLLVSCWFQVERFSSLSVCLS